MPEVLEPSEKQGARLSRRYKIVKLAYYKEIVRNARGNYRKKLFSP
jgi:hypothetical protein